MEDENNSTMPSTNGGHRHKKGSQTPKSQKESKDKQTWSI